MALLTVRKIRQIVGGGNAGNAIAARLALDPANYSIALLEAGSFYEISDGNRTQVPGYNWINTLDFPIGQVSTKTSIALHTLPQPVSRYLTKYGKYSPDSLTDLAFYVRLTPIGLFSILQRRHSVAGESLFSCHSNW